MRLTVNGSGGPTVLKRAAVILAKTDAEPQRAILIVSGLHGPALQQRCRWMQDPKSEQVSLRSCGCGVTRMSFGQKLSLEISN